MKGVLCCRFDGDLRTFEQVVIDYDENTCDHAERCLVTNCGLHNSPAVTPDRVLNQEED